VVTIEQSLHSAQGQELIGNLARAFGIDPQQTDAAVRYLADELNVRLQRAMLSRGGVADVVSLVTAPGAQSALSAPQALTSPDVLSEGNHILDVLIGDKHVSRGIAARTAVRTGVDAPTAQKMLPIVANLMIGELQRQSGPAIAKVAESIPGFGGAGGSPLPMPGDRFPPSRPDDSTAVDGQAPYTPTQRDGRGPIDGGSPLPIPGDNIPGLGRQGRAPQRDPDPDEDDNPYSRLPDIVRRGGQRVPGPDGGSLENIIRSILGNLLGSNSGVVGTMIKLFLVRWIVSLLRSVLGSVFRSR
jgi:hypothetical protein